MSSHNGDTQQNTFMPKFFVSQDIYDSLTPEERKKHHYVLDTQKTIELPKGFNLPRDLERDV